MAGGIGYSLIQQEMIALSTQASNALAGGLIALAIVSLALVTASCVLLAKSPRPDSHCPKLFNTKGGADKSVEMTASHGNNSKSHRHA